MNDSSSRGVLLVVAGALVSNRGRVIDQSTEVLSVRCNASSTVSNTNRARTQRDSTTGRAIHGVISVIGNIHILFKTPTSVDPVASQHNNLPDLYGNPVL
jgi:hypothetical protein